MPILTDNAAATAIAGALNIQVWAFDNTYFGRCDVLHVSGHWATPSARVRSPPTSSSFKTYFTGSTGGSAFAMLLSFPVTGNAAEIGLVTVQMTNAAGTTSLTNLVFLNDSGTCVLIGNVLSSGTAPLIRPRGGPP